uniref:Uncharacterized protein n=2 Tax=Oryza sativa TaxID=4530 RepID=Q5Z8M7_ORYSJ|nr:putative glycine-rich protein [Oryza sativa Japonica Group]BAD61735.1 hypothetical protein [Oryza sativa Japonica Group]BAD62354.1 hypothetical protein [Oryza sativa Japonica Group]
MALEDRSRDALDGCHPCPAPSPVAEAGGDVDAVFLGFIYNHAPLPPFTPPVPCRSSVIIAKVNVCSVIIANPPGERGGGGGVGERRDGLARLGSVASGWQPGGVGGGATRDGDAAWPRREEGAAKWRSGAAQRGQVVASGRDGWEMGAAVVRWNGGEAVGVVAAAVWRRRGAVGQRPCAAPQPWGKGGGTEVEGGSGVGAGGWRFEVEVIRRCRAYGAGDEAAV